MSHHRDTTNCCVLAVTILVVGDYGADVAAMGFGVASVSYTHLVSSDDLLAQFDGMDGTQNSAVEEMVAPL